MLTSARRFAAQHGRVRSGLRLLSSSSDDNDDKGDKKKPWLTPDESSEQKGKRVSNDGGNGNLQYSRPSTSLGGSESMGEQMYSTTPRRGRDDRRNERRNDAPERPVIKSNSVDGPDDASKVIASLAGARKNFYAGQTYNPLALIGKKAVDPRSKVGGKRRPPAPNTLLKTGFEIHPFNTTFLQHFIGPSGMILSRSNTGLSAKNQRKVAKAIKTARQLGLLAYLEGYNPMVDTARTDEPYDRVLVDQEGGPPVYVKVAPKDTKES